jgi:hypothetical protein
VIGSDKGQQTTEKVRKGLGKGLEGLRPNFHRREMVVRVRVFLFIFFGPDFILINHESTW